MPAFPFQAAVGLPDDVPCHSRKGWTHCGLRARCQAPRPQAGLLGGVLRGRSLTSVKGERWRLEAPHVGLAAGMERWPWTWQLV